MRVNFTDFQKGELSQYIEVLRDIKIKQDHIVFDVGEELKTEKITKERMSWIRLQKGTEVEFKNLLFELLLPLAKEFSKKHLK